MLGRGQDVVYTIARGNLLLQTLSAEQSEALTLFADIAEVKDDL